MKFGLRAPTLRKESTSPSRPPDTVTEVALPRKSLGSAATRSLLEALTAQQASLVRAVALSRADYLNRSFYVDPATGKRVAHEVQESELVRFASEWERSPMACIASMNRAIAPIEEAARRVRYIRSAVDLEILMDGQVWSAGAEEPVRRGIPAYLMNGYTDMGTLASTTQRNGREKIKVDKASLKARLASCRRQGVNGHTGARDLVAWCYDAVRTDIEFDEMGVERLYREYGSESIVLSQYLEKRMGVCRHLSIIFQLYLQETGVRSRLVKGNLRFFVFSGRHAWNMVQLEDGVALVDVTHPNIKTPFIVEAPSEREVYRRAREHSRDYAPTPDAQNHYKIGPS